ncbi:MAG: hypothetical protein Kow00109_29720 [Acidobacteriota bacterium]
MARRTVRWLVGWVGAAALLVSLCGVAQAAGQASQEKQLKVKLNYKGAGPVDAGHCIQLFTFDNPNFIQNPGTVMPIGMNTVCKNGEVVTLGLWTDTVYLVAVYDEQGVYQTPMGPPPSGLPVAVYRPGDPNPPTPIRLESEVTEIEFAFDDSFRMP